MDMRRTSRKREREELKLIDDIVIALCADYERRKICAREESVPKRVRMEYLYINTRMLAAAGEIAGIYFAEIIIREIGSKTGYANSEIDSVSELSYKKIKQKAKRQIAKALYLE